MAESKDFKKYLKQLKKRYEGLGERIKLYEKELENMAFILTQLDKLQKQIAEEGATEVYKNGEKQTGIKVSASLNAYQTFIKSYDTLAKRLDNLVPKQDTQKEDDPLIDFISG